MKIMEKKWMVVVHFVLLVCFIIGSITGQEAEQGTEATPAQSLDQKMNAHIFIKQFTEAFKVKDMGRMKELVRGIGPENVFNTVIYFSAFGIWDIAAGKTGSDYLGITEAIAAIHADVSQNDGLLELVRRYQGYTQAMCEEKRKGDDLLLEGFHFYFKGQVNEALEKWNEALKIFQKLGDAAGEGKSLGNIGNAYAGLGQYGKALRCYQQCIEKTHKINDVGRESECLNNSGIVYALLGQSDQAIQCYRQSREIMLGFGKNTGEAKSLVGIGNHPIESSYFINIGQIYEDLGQYDQAMQYYLHSLEITRKIKDESGELGALGNIGNTYSRLGRYDQALPYYRQSLEIARKINDMAGEAASLSGMGVVYFNLGQSDQAIQSLQESIKISERLGVLEAAWRSNYQLGRLFRRSGKSEEAVAYCQKAIDIIEELYGNTQGLKEEERSSMIGKKSFVYQKFIELLLELHRKFPDKGYDKKAFSISEKGKSRTFQELMAKAGAKIAFTGDENFKKMIAQEQQLIIELTNLRTMLIQEFSKPEKQRNEEVAKSLKERIEKKEKILQDHVKEIDSKYPRYADLKRPKSLSVEDLQEILKPGETVIAYAVGEEKVVAFLIAKERFKMVELEAQPGELAQLIKAFRKGLENVSEMKDLEEFKPETAYALYQKLLAPLSADLKGITQLYIAADDMLYTLPFEALVDQEMDKEKFREARQQGKKGSKAYLGEYATLHYLVDTYTITYLPSASMLRSLRKYEKPGYGKWTKPLIAFADPVFSAQDEKSGTTKSLESKGISAETELTLQILTRSTGGDAKTLPRLKESAEEAAAIGKEVKGKPEDMYLREKATEENVYKSKLQEARYLLFSTHGLLGGEFKGVAEPALALTLVNNPEGRDGFLSMSEVLGLDLNAELIILSACNTSGQGDKAGAGEGFVGLTRSFMYAGTRSILVTHWSVESQAARDLMVAVFKNMSKKQRPEALRKAKLWMKGSFRDDKDMPNGKLSLSHPFFWAPFVIMGEGE